MPVKRIFGIKALNSKSIKNGLDNVPQSTIYCNDNL